MLYKICCVNSDYYYDSNDGTIYDENKVKVNFHTFPHLSKYIASIGKTRRDLMWRRTKTSDLISRKSKDKISIIKIKLGSKCNYKCKYCIQPQYNSDIQQSINFSDQQFFEMMKISFDWDNINIVELWGGEPLVYWKVITRIVTILRERLNYTKGIIMITNGSLLDDSKADFIIRHNIVTIVSHDGPAQTIYRNEQDCLDDPKVKNAILRIAQHQPLKFNMVPGPYSYDLSKVYEYISKKVDELPFSLNNDMIFRACKSTEHILDDYEDMNKVRDTFIRSILTSPGQPYYELYTKFRNNSEDIIIDLVGHRRMSSHTSFCPVQKESIITIDVHGRNSLCHNADYDGGYRMKGQLPNIDSFFVEGLAHVQTRERCMRCPYLVACGGGCPNLDDENHAVQCRSIQPYVQAHFAAAWYKIFNDTIVQIVSEDDKRTSYY